MARRKGAETPGSFWRLIFGVRLLPLTIIVLSLFMIFLSSCARGGGTPVSEATEAGVDSSMPIKGDATTAGPICGNGKIDMPNEQCDGIDLGNATCMTLSNEQGDLRCTQTCTYDDSMCYPGPQDSGSGVEETGTAGGYGGP